jgi:exopolysaccharide production protein ExoQ
MYSVSMNSSKLSQTRSRTSIIDRLYVVIPIFACTFALVASPLFLLAADLPLKGQSQALLDSPRPENRIFWPALAALSIALAARDRSRLSKLSLSPNVVCLLAYMALAGASVFWALDPWLSFQRYVLQVMILISVILPTTLLAGRMADLMRGLFLCFAFASILNVFFVIGRPPTDIGYAGYFLHKNALGAAAAITFILALHETSFQGARRTFGVVMIIIATFLLIVSESKTSLGFAMVAPTLAGLVVAVGVSIRISPIIILFYMVVLGATFYATLSEAFDFDISTVSLHLFGDPTFTGRTSTWAFALDMIERRPLLGWGYQSFWLVGPDAPSVLDAPGWVAEMPDAHNGYLDTILETGLLGLAVLTTFIIATLNAVGRVAEREPLRAWLALSLMLFIILYNGLESTLVHGFAITWVVFAILAASGRSKRCSS